MLAAGTMPGRNRVLSTLGVGGKSEVHRARDTRLHPDVAIPIIRGDAVRDPERFERDARPAGASIHSHACPVFDIGVPWLRPESPGRARLPREK